MHDFVLYERISALENSVDSLTKEIYNLKQQQKDMLEQIKLLKERQSDGSGK